ncbi:MAG: methyltransferase domain-containing protein [Elusimicrobiota bacterium]
MKKDFWNIKAKKYPRAFDQKNYKDSLDLIKKIEELGVSFERKKIADIGCGTGNYSLVLAQKASEVFCLDFSPEMLKILKKDASLNGIKNISVELSSFEDFDARSKEKYFDISFASMTPAIKTKEEVLKMEYICKEFCVFIGWAGKRENKVADRIIKAHGIKPYHPKGFLEVKDILKERNIEFKEYSFESSWDWTGTMDEAIEDFSARIRMEDIEPNREKIISILKDEFPSGNIKMRTLASQGLLIWKPSN